MSKAKIFIIIIIASILIGWNDKIIPSRHEVSDSEPVRVLGLDVALDNKSIFLSIVRENSENSGSSSDGGDNGKSKKQKQEIVTINAKTFEEAMRILQTYSTKQITGEHVAYVILGEHLAKSALPVAMDFMIRDEDLRLTSNVYISKNLEAVEFLKSATTSDELLADKLKNLQRSIRNLGTAHEIRLIDILGFSLTKKATGLIPSLSLEDLPDNLDFSVISSKEKDSKSIINLPGYAVIKNSSLVTYLDLPASFGYNFITDNVISRLITVLDNHNHTVCLDLTRAKTNFVFDCDNDIPKRLTIKIKTRCNYSQVSARDNIQEKEIISYLQNKASYSIRQEVLSVVSASKNLDADFINLEKKFEIAHPYKYQKIKDSWAEIQKNLEVDVVVETQIERTYDIIDLLPVKE